MNSKTWTRIITVALLAALALPLQLAAQNTAKRHRPHPHRYHHYQVTGEGMVRILVVSRVTGMYGPPLCRKRKMKVTRWSAQMYSAFVGAQSSWP
jgi:hypothetical protein